MAAPGERAVSPTTELLANLKQLKLIDNKVKSTDTGNCVANVVAVLDVSSAISKPESTVDSQDRRCVALNPFDDYHGYMHRIDL